MKCTLVSVRATPGPAPLGATSESKQPGDGARGTRTPDLLGAILRLVDVRDGHAERLVDGRVAFLVAAGIMLAGLVITLAMIKPGRPHSPSR
jgi:hypothetical protein